MKKFIIGLVVAASVATLGATADSASATGISPCANVLQQATLTLNPHGPGTADDTYTASGYAYTHRLDAGITYTLPTGDPDNGYFQLFTAHAKAGRYVSNYRITYPGGFQDDENANSRSFGFGNVGPDASIEKVELCVVLGFPPSS